MRMSIYFKKQRKSRKFTQKQVGKALGIVQSTVCRIEKAEISPDLLTIVAFNNFIGYKGIIKAQNKLIDLMEKAERRK